MSGTEHVARPEPSAHAELLGSQLVDFDADAMIATVRFTARKELCTPRGGVLGGFVAGFIDEVMGFACVAATNGEIAPLNLDISVSLLRQIPQDATIIGKGRVVRLGKRVMFLEAELLAEDGTIYARGSSTALPSPVPR